MLQHILGAGPFGGVDGETTQDEVLGRLGEILPTLVLPMFNELTLVVTSDDGLNCGVLLLGLRVPVKRRAATEDEIGDDAHGPDVDGFVIAGCTVYFSQPSDFCVKKPVTHSLRRPQVPYTEIRSVKDDCVNCC